MSWSISAIGKTKAVESKLEAELSRITYLRESEAAIKDLVARIIKTALTEMSEVKGRVIKVEAAGSASFDPQTGTIHTLSVSIQPIYGFVE